MAYYTTGLNQMATYFPPAGQNGFGDPQFGAAVTVMVRWQDKADLFRDVHGREVVSSAVVYVSQDVEVSGRIALGEITDPSAAREIRQCGKSPSRTASTELVKLWV